MNKSVFDITDTSDLPENLRVNPVSDFGRDIVRVFEQAESEGLSELNVNQVTVAFHRMFGKNYKQPKNSIQIMNKLFAMAKGKKFPIEKVAGPNGTYRLKK